ncbi:ceramidase domain-containing protein [Niveibacterium umoris]|uniref:Ceramidase n=1 Tax=Niveibacterium umoris TaxID=1193620 RepID=A0A840BRC6_9RHOO|nr:hypothetical protein [Niveibacterium umoris]MBB4013346.1 hypothetical protein [Niveibacterium umoris]
MNAGAYDFIDAYCERAGPGLWAEPLSALSNLAFVITALIAWRRLHGRDAVTDLRLLAGLIFCIAIGSLAFHTVAQRWAMFLDTGFITLFLLVYLHRFLVRRAGLGTRSALAGVAVFIAIDLGLPEAMSQLPLNGSEFYAGAALALLVAALWTTRKGVPGGPALVQALAMLVGALLARSVDQALCTVWPSGTHFIWHLLNAPVLDALMRAISASDPRSAAEAGAGYPAR